MNNDIIKVNANEAATGELNPASGAANPGLVMPTGNKPVDSGNMDAKHPVHEAIDFLLENTRRAAQDGGTVAHAKRLQDGVTKAFNKEFGKHNHHDVEPLTQPEQERRREQDSRQSMADHATAIDRGAGSSDPVSTSRTTTDLSKGSVTTDDDKKNTKLS